MADDALSTHLLSALLLAGDIRAHADVVLWALALSSALYATPELTSADGWGPGCKRMWAGVRPK